jgi:hypothetical protein
MLGRIEVGEGRSRHDDQHGGGNGNTFEHHRPLGIATGIAEFLPLESLACPYGVCRNAAFLDDLFRCRFGGQGYAGVPRLYPQFTRFA